jgi:DNA-binding XRE family transcriptional regulator
MILSHPTARADGHKDYREATQSASRGGARVTLLRDLLGARLRRERQEQSRTLRDVSATARVSLGYLSEVERGQKEPSSELLAAICGALEVPLSEVLRDVSGDMAMAELAAHIVTLRPVAAVNRAA